MGKRPPVASPPASDQAHWWSPLNSIAISHKSLEETASALGEPLGHEARAQVDLDRGQADRWRCSRCERAGIIDGGEYRSTGTST